MNKIMMKLAEIRS